MKRLISSENFSTSAIGARFIEELYHYLSKFSQLAQIFKGVIPCSLSEKKRRAGAWQLMT
jgi:hypothetical protein